MDRTGTRLSDRKALDFFPSCLRKIFLLLFLIASHQNSVGRHATRAGVGDTKFALPLIARLVYPGRRLQRTRAGWPHKIPFQLPCT